MTEARSAGKPLRGQQEDDPGRSEAEYAEQEENRRPNGAADRGKDERAEQIGKTEHAKRRGHQRAARGDTSGLPGRRLRVLPRLLRGIGGLPGLLGLWGLPGLLGLLGLLDLRGLLGLAGLL